MASLALRGGSGLEENVEKKNQPAAMAEAPLDRRRRLRRRKDRRKASLLSSLRIVAICGVIVCLGLYGPNLNKLQQIRAEISGLQAQCDEWRQRNLEVMAQIENARSDAFVRQAARERLGLVDQGTILYIAQIPGSGATTDRTPESQPLDRASQSLAMSPPSSP